MPSSVPRQARPSHPARSVGRLLLVAGLLAMVACAAGLPLETVARHPVPPAVLRFEEDTFAFPNDVRALQPDKPDLYANYCFVMIRGVVQFWKFARFAPDRPKVSAEEYTDLVRQVTARAPWEDALTERERVQIPGYRNLREFSRTETEAVKAGLNSRFWSWIHWTNWRVAWPASGDHQEHVAGQVMTELQAGRPVMLLITSMPVIEVNHGVVVYAYRTNGDGEVEFTIYDPDGPSRPWLISFQTDARQFWATRMPHARPGKLRAFRMYYSPWL